MKECNFKTKPLAVEAYNIGSPPKRLAQIFQARPHSSIFGCCSFFRTGKKNNSPHGHHARRPGPEKPRTLTLAKPDRTSDELRQAWATFAKEPPASELGQAWATGLKKTLKADQQNRPDMAAAREQWPEA